MQPFSATYTGILAVSPSGCPTQREKELPQRTCGERERFRQGECLPLDPHLSLSGVQFSTIMGSSWLVYPTLNSAEQCFVPFIPVGQISEGGAEPCFYHELTK